MTKFLSFRLIWAFIAFFAFFFFLLNLAADFQNQVLNNRLAFILFTHAVVYGIYLNSYWQKSGFFAKAGSKNLYSIVFNTILFLSLAAILLGIDQEGELGEAPWVFDLLLGVFFTFALFKLASKREKTDDQKIILTVLILFFACFLGYNTAIPISLFESVKIMPFSFNLFFEKAFGLLAWEFLPLLLVLQRLDRYIFSRWNTDIPVQGRREKLKKIILQKDRLITKSSIGILLLLLAWSVPAQFPSGNEFSKPFIIAGVAQGLYGFFLSVILFRLSGRRKTFEDKPGGQGAAIILNFLRFYSFGKIFSSLPYVSGILEFSFWDAGFHALLLFLFVFSSLWTSQKENAKLTTRVNDLYSLVLGAWVLGFWLITGVVQAMERKFYAGYIVFSFTQIWNTQYLFFIFASCIGLCFCCLTLYIRFMRREPAV